MRNVCKNYCCTPFLGSMNSRTDFKQTPASLLAALVQGAHEARGRSYSPYSKAQVGAAVRSATGAVYSGCNIENSSFGGTVCAERVAIWNGVATEGPSFKLAEVAVSTDASPPWTPCGLCRQVMAEFGSQTTVVVCENPSGERIQHPLGALIPFAFLPDQLTAHMAKANSRGQSGK